MRERFLEYADKLINQEDRIDIYKNLIEIFDKNCLFHEEGACYEKLWHITQQAELYKDVGDIFANKVGNFNIANQAYNRYLQFSDKKFFENYGRVLKKLGHDFDTQIDDEDYSQEIIKLCDNYDTIVYMMLCLLQIKDFEGVLKLDEKLQKADSVIKQYISENPANNYDNYLEDNKSSAKYLADVLSKTEHHNDINILAMKYDSTNKQPYINIMADYITYKNYNEAIMFYNYTYAPAFNIIPKPNIVDICWEISDFYRDKYDFYKAVLFQKYALERDLAEV